MRKYIYLLPFFILLFNGCQPKNNENSNFTTWSRNTIQKIEKIEFDNAAFIDSCLFISLKTSDESLFGAVSQIEVFDDTYYILDKQTMKLKVFDSYGNFLYDIGKKGQGPGEYVAINFFVLNPEERKIGLFDPRKRTVHEYTLDGRFLQSKPQNWGFSSITKATCVGKYIYCLSNINDEDNMTYIIISSEDYSIIEKICPYPIKPSISMYVSIMNHPYSIVNGKFHYVSLFSDTIYTFENGKTTPYLFVETGKPNISTDYLKKRDLIFAESPISSYLEVLRDNRYSPGFTELGETNRFIIGKAHLNNNFFILDKKKKEGFHVADSSFPDLGSPLAMEGNKMIRVWNPADISRYQDMMEEEKRAWPKQIESLIKNYDPDYENPVLIVYYMKD